ncbi:MAG: hypothetical protein K0R18_273 [Bacillales bacterium]|jgi:hypothetical protein|nr:hypothetical protein [Bacillales bacterium]
MKPITVWEVAKGNDVIEYEHNHIEDGHVDGEYPLPLKPEFTNQKSWKNFSWRKTFAHLDKNYRVVK